MELIPFPGYHRQKRIHGRVATQKYRKSQSIIDAILGRVHKL